MKEVAAVPIKYKIDLNAAFHKKGYSLRSLRSVFGQSTFTKFRRGIIVSPEVLSRACFILGCQPGDLIEYEESSEEVAEITKRIREMGGEIHTDTKK